MKDFYTKAGLKLLNFEHPSFASGLCRWEWLKTQKVFISLDLKRLHIGEKTNFFRSPEHCSVWKRQKLLDVYMQTHRKNMLWLPIHHLIVNYYKAFLWTKDNGLLNFWVFFLSFLPLHIKSTIEYLNENEELTLTRALSETTAERVPVCLPLYNGLMFNSKELFRFFSARGAFFVMIHCNAFVLNRLEERRKAYNLID